VVVGGGNLSECLSKDFKEFIKIKRAEKIHRKSEKKGSLEDVDVSKFKCKKFQYFLKVSK